jgi:hypothetical protein
LDQKTGDIFILGELTTQVVTGIAFDNQHPLVSVASMLAPSPDYFSGVSSFDLRDTSTNMWLQEIVLDVYPWSAGTDSGLTYLAPDSPEAFPGGVHRLDITNTPGNILRSPEGDTILPVGKIQCSLGGQRAAACRANKDLTGRCRRNGACCPGLTCIGMRSPLGRPRQCLPCLLGTQACNNDSNCCGRLRCRRGMCNGRI